MVEFIRVAFVVVTTIGGYLLGNALPLPQDFKDYRILSVILSVIIFAGVGYVVGGVAGRRLAKIFNWVESKIQAVTPMELALSVGGLLLGLVLALLISIPFGFLRIPFLQFSVAIFAFAAFGYAGVRIALRKAGDLSASLRGKVGKGAAVAALDEVARDKILDTSAIIDGRIIDVVKTGIIEGRLVVAGFVLRELQAIADSDDQLKRNRGRRGLDILKTLQRDPKARLEILDRDYPEHAAVDAKLVRLARDSGGVIVTNDYNLNRVADLQGVPVLNLNEVANALKPVVLPGEVVRVELIREGKEEGQGVGYLDDGTMVVVDGGGFFVGKKVEAEVTSVLQTPAGRMVFGKLEDRKLR